MKLGLMVTTRVLVRELCNLDIFFINAAQIEAAVANSGQSVQTLLPFQRLRGKNVWPARLARH